MIYRLQEEVHRFAVKAVMGAKRKSLRGSSLTKIPGIGEKKAKLLLDAMPYKDIRTADEETLAGVRGISRSDAHAVYNYFHGNEGD